MFNKLSECERNSFANVMDVVQFAAVQSPTVPSNSEKQYTSFLV